MKSLFVQGLEALDVLTIKKAIRKAFKNAGYRSPNNSSIDLYECTTETIDTFYDRVFIYCSLYGVKCDITIKCSLDSYDICTLEQISYTN